MSTKSEDRLKRIERTGKKPKFFQALEDEFSSSEEQGFVWGMSIVAAFLTVLLYVGVMGVVSIFFNPGLGNDNPADWFWKSWIGVGVGTYALLVTMGSILPATTRRYYSMPKYATAEQVDAVRAFQGFTGEERSLARPVYIEFLSRDPSYAGKPYNDAEKMWNRMTLAVSKRRELYAEQEALESYEAAHALAALESHNNDMSKELKERAS